MAGYPVYITNSEMIQWYEEQNADRANLQTQTLAWTALLAAQMLIYYNLWDNMVDQRDQIIDHYMNVVEYVHSQDMTVDYPWLQFKQEILNLAVPLADVCLEAKRFTDESVLDGQVVDTLAHTLIQRGCRDMPRNWVIHEGALYASRGHNHASGFLAQAMRRREESFRQKKTQLVLNAQQASEINLSAVYDYYQQALAIFQDLASVFLKGFTSAGYGLGINLDRLSRSNIR